MFIYISIKSCINQKASSPCCSLILSSLITLKNLFIAIFTFSSKLSLWFLECLATNCRSSNWSIQIHLQLDSRFCLFQFGIALKTIFFSKDYNSLIHPSKAWIVWAVLPSIQRSVFLWLWHENKRRFV